MSLAPCSKVLIANRGEVVSRVARTCRLLGLKTVAVFSEADAALPFVRDTDESELIGSAAAAHSYLDMAKIVAAAKKHNCDAIHPGWGFLSERADFADAVTAAGKKETNRGCFVRKNSTTTTTKKKDKNAQFRF